MIRRQLRCEQCGATNDVKFVERIRFFIICLPCINELFLDSERNPNFGLVSKCDILRFFQLHRGKFPLVDNYEPSYEKRIQRIRDFIRMDLKKCIFYVYIPARACRIGNNQISKKTSSFYISDLTFSFSLFYELARDKYLIYLLYTPVKGCLRKTGFLVYYLKNKVCFEYSRWNLHDQNSLYYIDSSYSSARSCSFYLKSIEFSVEKKTLDDCYLKTNTKLIIEKSRNPLAFGPDNLTSYIMNPDGYTDFPPGYEVFFSHYVVDESVKKSGVHIDRIQQLHTFKTCQLIHYNCLLRHERKKCLQLPRFKDCLSLVSVMKKSMTNESDVQQIQQTQQTQQIYNVEDVLRYIASFF